jgi:peptide/nickel transport system ATP-binding protein
MYAGQVVEEATREAFFSRAAHPYSRRLFAALPDTARHGARLATIPGSVPPLEHVHVGCRFSDRCELVEAGCRLNAPDWRKLEREHRVRCYVEARSAKQQPLSGDEGTASPLGTGRALLEVADLAVHFPIRQGLLQRATGHVLAVDGVSLKIRSGCALALVGESGCGKTTVGKAILRLLQPTGGRIELQGANLVGMTQTELLPHRKLMQMVFQDPFASLNPRMRAGETIEEGLVALGVSFDAAFVSRLLEQVGLRPDMASRYPHEFSGGQQQRIAIARALAVKPQLLICDEPTSALDVSVQAQILNLLADLQRDMQLAYLFITHNISVVEHIAHDVAVMYLGRVVEQGRVHDVLGSPRHPYTKALIAAVPRLDGLPVATRLQGDMPSPAKPPSGCHFHPRCSRASELCARVYPPATVLDGAQAVCCHHPL